VEKKEPDMAELDKQKPQLSADLARNKGAALLSGWSRQRCIEARDAGSISVSSKLIDYGEADDSGKPIPTAYQPCSSAGLGMLQGIEGLPPGIQIPGM
jgi:hypothetical protein